MTRSVGLAAGAANRKGAGLPGHLEQPARLPRKFCPGGRWKDVTKSPTLGNFRHGYQWALAESACAGGGKRCTQSATNR
jgi:hypothetical protein